MTASKFQATSPACVRPHLPGLDGIRGLAIMMVMLGHFLTIGGHLNNQHPVSRLFSSGFLGVDLFFSLSGFLITGILIDSKMRQGYFRVFYLRRALRIFPLYYGLLTVSCLSVLWITPHDQELLVGHHSMLWHWLYASNIGIAVNHGNWLMSPTWVSLGHFWSLAVEEQFYLIWPLLVFLVSTLRLKQICSAMVLLSPLVALVMIFTLGPLSTYVATPARCGELAAGAWLAVLWRDPAGWAKLQPRLRNIAIATGCILLLERTVLPSLVFAEPSLALVLSGACVGLAVSQSGNGNLQRLANSSLLRWFGKYSYGIYVYHHALKPVWVHFLWQRWIVPALGTGWTATLCYTAAASMASITLAWLSWKFFEGPLLTLKSRITFPPMLGKASA